MKKIIGIIGGMGPLATADLFEKIIQKQSDRLAQLSHPTKEQLCIITEEDVIIEM